MTSGFTLRAATSALGLLLATNPQPPKTLRTTAAMRPQLPALLRAPP